jgi:crotonobetainyl-CoA:carnitine CoA-transferase CaiB-like acyl-CoA transferase
VEEKQAQALDIIQPVPGEDLTLVALPLSFDGTRPKIRRAPPKLGEHTDEVRSGKRRWLSGDRP